LSNTASLPKDIEAPQGKNMRKRSNQFIKGDSTTGDEDPVSVKKSKKVKKVDELYGGLNEDRHTE
jgi:hypothetical protein